MPTLPKFHPYIVIAMSMVFLSQVFCIPQDCMNNSFYLRGILLDDEGNTVNTVMIRAEKDDVYGDAFNIASVPTQSGEFILNARGYQTFECEMITVRTDKAAGYYPLMYTTYTNYIKPSSDIYRTTRTIHPYSSETLGTMVFTIEKIPFPIFTGYYFSAT